MNGPADEPRPGVRAGSNSSEVRQIGVADLKRLGIDGANQLYWDDQRVEIRRPLTLTTFQKVLTTIVTVFAVLGGLGGFVTGLNNASIFLCARGIDWLTCPAAR